MFARAAMIATLLAAGAADLLWINAVLVPEWLGTTPLVVWPGARGDRVAWQDLAAPDSRRANDVPDLDPARADHVQHLDEAQPDDAQHLERAREDDARATLEHPEAPDEPAEPSPAAQVDPGLVVEDGDNPDDTVVTRGGDAPGAQDDEVDVPAVARADALPATAVVPVPDRNAGVELPRTILFREIGSFALGKQSREQLKVLADHLRENPNLVVVLRGFSDRRGGTRVNLELSNKRARVVRAYLIHRGVAASRIRAEGVGKSDAVIADSGREAFVLERRVDIIVSEAP